MISPAFNKWFCMASAVLMLMFAGCSTPPAQEYVDIAGALSAADADIDCYNTAREVKAFDFPDDSGAHDDFRTEWWYYTGNLETTEGRHFGYQLTFFRQALTCDAAKSESEWRTRQIYFAHFAVTDTSGQKFFSDVRMNRHSLDIAGASARPYRVWVDNWQAERVQEKKIQLTAKAKEVGISFMLEDGGRLVLQGDRGYSRKGGQGHNASYYYSKPRLKTSGIIKIGSESHAVSGLTWFDHEWSTGALDQDVAGWDWFSVHLEDGRDLMVCLIRDSIGNPNGYGFGSVSDTNGRYAILSEKDFSIVTKKYWKSPASGRKYPAAWMLKVPEYGVMLDVVPVIADQEHTHMFPYWEGAARFSGKDVSGYGYVELTGY